MPESAMTLVVLFAIPALMFAAELLPKGHPIAWFLDAMSCTCDDECEEEAGDDAGLRV